MVPLSLWYSSRSGAFAEHTPDASSPCGLGGGFCSAANRVLQPAPAKTKTIMQSTISCQLLVPCSRWEVARHVENVAPKTPNRNDNWRFDIVMSIASSENEDCHEDRGPNPLDPCDCCRRHSWGGRCLAFPPPPPPAAKGLGAGGGACGKGSGPLELQMEGRPGSQRGPGSYTNPTQAINPITWRSSACSCYINLNLYFKPYTQP